MSEAKSQVETGDVTESIRRAAEHALGETIRAGTEAYDRLRDLPKLARVDTLAGLADTTEHTEAIVARLARALRAERNRARSGHWTYDLNRHIALCQAHRAETERLNALRNGKR